MIILIFPLKITQKSAYNQRKCMLFFMFPLKINFFHLFLWRKEKIQKETFPPSIKVLVWLTSLCPFGVGPDFC